MECEKLSFIGRSGESSVSLLLRAGMDKFAFIHYTERLR